MMDSLEHRAAGDLLPSWLGSTVTVWTPTGPLTGALSDFEFHMDGVLLFIAGRRVLGAPSSTVTRGDLDLPGTR